MVGSSFGGLIAYEMAQQLLAAGEQVALLVLLDTVNPVVARQTRGALGSNLLAHGPGYMWQSFRFHLAALTRRLRRMPQLARVPQLARYRNR